MLIENAANPSIIQRGMAGPRSFNPHVLFDLVCAPKLERLYEVIRSLFF